MKTPPKKKKSPKAAETSGPTLAQFLAVGSERNIWRSAVARVRHIHEQVRTLHYPNCRTLAKKFGISFRTIERDMLSIRDSLKLPLDFDWRKNGYYYTREVPADLPRPRLGAGDIVAFSLAKRSLERFRGTDFAVVFEEALQKVTDEVEGEVPLEWEELDRLVSIGGTGGAKPPAVEIAAAVSEALLRQRELKLRYWDLEGIRHEARQLQPLHLRAYGESLLLFALDPKRTDGEVRRFVLSRMKNVQVTERTFERPAGFDPDEEMRHSVGAYRGGKPERVHLRLSALATRMLDERPLHHSQKLALARRPARKGRKKSAPEPETENSPALSPDSPEYCRHGELTMNVALTPELEQKILYWAAEVEVVEPAGLRQRFEELGALLARRHR